MTLDHSDLLQVDATMIVGILIFLSFSGSLFQGINPMVEIEKMRQEARNMLTDLNNRITEIKNLITETNDNITLDELQQRSTLEELLLMRNEVQNRINGTMAQNLQMRTESTGRLLQVTFILATLVPFSLSSLILLVYNLRTPQSELEKKELEKKYLRISVIVMLSGFVILVIFLLYLTYTAFMGSVGSEIERIGSLT